MKGRVVPGPKANRLRDNRERTNMKNTLTPEQLEALELFADANGRSWKDRLRTVWMNGAYNYAVMGGADAGALQRIRNEFGPAWLTRFSLRDARIARRAAELAAARELDRKALLAKLQLDLSDMPAKDDTRWTDAEPVTPATVDDEQVRYSLVLHAGGDVVNLWDGDDAEELGDQVSAIEHTLRLTRGTAQIEIIEAGENRWIDYTRGERTELPPATVVDTTVYEVWNGTTGESHGKYESLSEARGAVAYDGLNATGYTIWAESGNGIAHRLDYVPSPADRRMSAKFAE
jgi:hypothetical protein